MEGPVFFHGDLLPFDDIPLADEQIAVDCEDIGDWEIVEIYLVH